MRLRLRLRLRWRLRLHLHLHLRHQCNAHDLDDRVHGFYCGCRAVELSVTVTVAHTRAPQNLTKWFTRLAGCSNLIPR
jgi:hypothetical protein